MPTGPFSNDASTTGLYHLDETSGTSFADASSGGHTANFSTSIPTFPTWVANEYPLPVELSSFQAISKNNSVDLVWQTVTETNNAGFDIEKRIGQDGVWNTIGFVSGHGTTNQPQTYSYSQNNLPNGTYFYRLKQLDRNGRFTYSKVIEAVINTRPEGFSLDQNYPNPFNPSTKIVYSLPEASHVRLAVYDIYGREAALLVNEYKSAGNYEIHFNASTLASGSYFYRLETSAKTFTRRMILVK